MIHHRYRGLENDANTEKIVGSYILKSHLTAKMYCYVFLNLYDKYYDHVM